MLPADEFFSPSSVNRKSSQSFLYIDLLFFLPIKLKLYVCVYIYIYIYIYIMQLYRTSTGNMENNCKR